MPSCLEPAEQLTSASCLASTEAPFSGGSRLVESLLHVVAALCLGLLAAGSAVVGLIWFSMRLPNG